MDTICLSTQQKQIFNVLVFTIHSCSKIQTREEDPDRRLVEPTPELEKEGGDTQRHNGGSFRKVLLCLALRS